ncbi:MAG: DUF4440 domain-containing protein [Porphyrobacter sp.]|nr:DUF4440 domain-containing protein [Porphyrobacter sp.]
MEDSRVWEFEESLWTGDAAHYRKLIDEECLMVLPTQPFVFTGEEAIAAVEGTPRWSQVSFADQQVARPQEGLIVMSYKAEATRDEERYAAYCTTTIRRCAHDVWRVLQHQQTLVPGRP